LHSDTRWVADMIFPTVRWAALCFGILLGAGERRPGRLWQLAILAGFAAAFGGLARDAVSLIASSIFGAGFFTVRSVAATALYALQSVAEWVAQGTVFLLGLARIMGLSKPIVLRLLPWLALAAA